MVTYSNVEQNFGNEMRLQGSIKLKEADPHQK